MDYLFARMKFLDRKYQWSQKNASRKKVHIYVFRHGHTGYNQQHRFCGWKESRLTDLGKKDAHKIRQKLRHKKIDLGFHSSLSRSKRTLTIALDTHAECTVRFCDDRLIERSYGQLEGKSHEWFVKTAGEHDLIEYLHWHKAHYLDYNHSNELIKKFGERDLAKVRRSYSLTPPGGESMKDVEKRVLAFLDDLLVICREFKVNVALSVHGNSMRPIRRYFENLSAKEMMHLENPWDQVYEYTVNL